MYRPEIDGLRALAVLAVIINHVEKEWLPGGYLGVDLFFVISGYVITSSLVARPAGDAGSFFLGFYARRIRRILPALAAMVLVVAPLTSAFDPAPQASLQTGLTALFGFSNVFLYLSSTSYFSISSDLNTFTHTWSLGVEEQFYFIFPLLVWVTGIGRAGRARWGWFTAGMLALCLASVIGFVVFSRTNQPFAYFSMLARFWELGMGALVYAGLRNPLLASCCARLPAGPLLLTLTALLFTASRVKSTVAVVMLMAVLLASLRAGTLTHRLLSLPPVRYLGLLSYSLYLWHWPVLALSRWTIGIHPWTLPLQVGLMGGLALASYHLVERPLHQARWLHGWKRPFGFGLLVAGGGALLPLGLMAWPGGSPLFLGDAELERMQGNLGDARPAIRRDCMWWMGKGPDPTEAARNCVIRSGSGGIRRRFFLMGDSHTGHLDDWLAHIPAGEGLWVRRAYAGGQSVPVVENRWEGKLASRRQDARQQQRLIDLTLDDLQRGDVLVLVTYILQQFRTEEQRLSHGFTLGLSRWDAWWRDLDLLVSRAGAKGASVVIASPLPDFELRGGWDNFTGQNCTHQWYRRELPPHCLLARPRATVIGEIEPVARRLQELERRHPNVHIFDGLPLLCPAGQEQCLNYANGLRTYSDYSHLTRSGSHLLSQAFQAFLRTRSLIPPPGSPGSVRPPQLSG